MKKEENFKEAKDKKLETLTGNNIKNSGSLANYPLPSCKKKDL